MVTKADLEEEVRMLRAELDATRQQQKLREDVDSQPDDTEADWLGDLEEALTEIEELPQKKPLLFALGVFALGYLAGRAK